MSKKHNPDEMIGMRRVMNNGHEAIIKAWRGYDDIDVYFSSLNILRKNMSYQNFKNGRIGLEGDYKNIKKGETVMQNCGLDAVIVVYRNSRDIDVQFPSVNVVKEHVSYDRFKKGLISPEKSFDKNDRVGEVVYQSVCGMNATIVKYVDSQNISITFESGETLDGIPYQSFKNGRVFPNSRLGKSKAVLQKRVGMVCAQSCGLDATIVAYRSSSDIDIVFSNGVTRTGVKYDSFVKGKISLYPNASLQGRVGEVCYQKSCEMNAKIITYRNSQDIDVEFDNQLIREHVTYAHFKNGTLRSMSNAEQAKCRIGEKVNTLYGECIIIKYNNANDVVVKFEDGTEVRTTYNSFLRGSIKNPNVKCNLKQRDERIGQRLQMKSTRWATVIEYNSYYYITVKFDDGVEVVTSWACFSRGLVGHPDDSPAAKRAARLGEVKTMNNQLQAQIIRYDGRDDIDVEFIEDHVVVKSTSYKQFLAGEIAHPTKRTKTTLSIEEFAIGYYLHRLGFVKIKQGQWADRGFDKLEIDFYHEDYNIAIEYDGEIHAMWDIPDRDVKKNEKCKSIGVQLYRLRHYNLPILSDGNSINYILKRPNGVQMRHRGIIDCKRELEEILKLNDIYVDSDFIDFDRDLDDIINEYKKVCVNYYENRHVGEVYYNKKSGQNMIIIAYRNFNDVDVEFSDGSRCYSQNYRKIKNGYARHPDYTSQSLAKQRLGQVKKNNVGKEMKIIAYRGAEDIDVLFTLSGDVRNNVRYAEFKKGTLSDPIDMRKRNR